MGRNGRGLSGGIKVFAIFEVRAGLLAAERFGILDAWPPMSLIDDKAADERNIAALLARTPFAGPSRAGAPLLVVAQSGPRIVFANQAVLTLFRATNLGQLNATLLNGASPGARRLRQLANTATIDAPPKLELLRFFIGRLPVQLGLQCASAANAQGEVFLIAAAPASAAVAYPASNDDVQPVESPPPVSAAIARPSVGDDGPRRFLWSANAESCFDSSAKALVEAVGDDAPREGESLEALKARTGIDPEGEFARALASRATFGALRLPWPRQAQHDPGKEAIVVVMSGAPIFDRQRRFLGYRGFGVFTGEIAPFTAPATRAHEPPAAILESAAGGDAEAPRPQTTPTSAEAPAPAPALADEPESADLAASNEDASPMEDEIEEWPPAPERSAEIVPWRASGPAYTGAPNVVPIRPGALPAFLSSDDGAQRGESVELTNHERDAFREIARALGAKIRDHREGRREPASDEADASEGTAQGHDVGFAALSAGVSAAEHNADDPVAAPALEAHRAESRAEDARNLLDRLPIGALVTRGEEALYLNRTLLDLLGYRGSGAVSRRLGVGPHIRRRPARANRGFRRSRRALVWSPPTARRSRVNGQIQAIDWGGAPATLISLRRSLEGEFAPQVAGVGVRARASARPKRARFRPFSTRRPTASSCWIRKPEFSP